MQQYIFYFIIIGFVLFVYFRKIFIMRSLNNYSAQEVKERIQSGSILLDVRTLSEHKSGAIPKSIHIPLHEISSRFEDMEKYRNKEIICYCASGSRSISAALKLKRAGFIVGNLKGGINSWNL
jgi:phage shock protein E